MQMKKALSLLLVAVLLVAMVPTAAFASAEATTAGKTQTFSDMPDNWSTKALENAVANGLLTGSDGKIKPDDSLTRAEMAVIINRAFGTTSMASLSGYSDVPAGSWYYNDMAKAVKMGIFIGDNGKLNPVGNITRQEVFV
ncbi:MAG: S-layer homology domain-containing protein, partial [Clostridia bacterium]|nr:S-layer homology domain-containing protein [Clostridia bacterium]